MEKFQEAAMKYLYDLQYYRGKALKGQARGQPPHELELPAEPEYPDRHPKLKTRKPVTDVTRLQKNVSDTVDTHFKSMMVDLEKEKEQLAKDEEEMAKEKEELLKQNANLLFDQQAIMKACFYDLQHVTRIKRKLDVQNRSSVIVKRLKRVPKTRVYERIDLRENDTVITLE